MKTREVIFDTDVILNLLDAYGNTKTTISVQANTPKAIAIPFKKEVYQDLKAQRFYIYEGEGVLRDVNINVRFFELNDEFIDSFDRFLINNECKASDRAIFEGIYKILDLNTSKAGYIKHSKIQALEMAIINKAGFKNAL